MHTKIPTQQKLLECAIAAAKTAGRHALSNIKRRHDIVKSYRHDIKLKLDLECQAIAFNTINRKFPHHPILGEEGSSSCSSSQHDFLWIVDPIDGTVNFSHGLPLWCCSVAVIYKGRTLAGAVYAPVMHELFAATANGPATRNNSAIKVSSVRSIKHAIVHTGLDKNYDSTLKPLAVFEKLALGTQKARVMGSAAYDICQVAAGHSDGYFESGIFIWDIAAAGLIVERAGGKIEQLRKPDKDHKLSFIASNGLIHAGLKRLIKTAKTDT